MGPHGNTLADSDFTILANYMDSEDSDEGDSTSTLVQLQYILSTNQVTPPT